MINDQYRVILTRIPKSASQSMEVALNEGLTDGWDKEHAIWRQHATLLEIKRFYASPEQFSDYFKFGFVRNPWSRLVSSFYFWGFPDNLPESKHKEAFTIFLKREGPFASGKFADMCDPRFYHTPKNIYHHLRPQYEFLFDDQGQRLADFVGKFENLRDDWTTVTNALGVSLLLPSRNRGANRDYREYYTAETMKIVKKRYEIDIDTFKYHFA